MTTMTNAELHNLITLVWGAWLGMCVAGIVFVYLRRRAARKARRVVRTIDVVDITPVEVASPRPAEPPVLICARCFDEIERPRKWATSNVRDFKRYR